MKVSSIMQRSVLTVSEDISVKEVGKLIFSTGLGGVPVVRGRKVVGIVTEEDVLSRMYPSMDQLIEDYVHSSDFEGMEKNLLNLIDVPVKDVMTKKVVTITGDTPIMKAQSIMLVNKFSRLPVVDENKNLIGLISHGDVFRAVVGDKLPMDREEEVFTWLARHYDIILNWKVRLSKEVPGLTKLFKKENVKKILDVGCASGWHSIALAQKGFDVFGIDSSGLMVKMAGEKRKKLPEEVKNRLAFLAGRYSEVQPRLASDFDAAIFMGNALPYIHFANRNIVKEIAKDLNPKKSLLFFQIINFNKFLKKGGLIEFVTRNSHLGFEKEHAFLGFYNRVKGDVLNHSWVIFDFDGKKWAFKGMNSAPLINLNKEKIEKILKNSGFSKVSFYGSSLYGPLFDSPFDPKKSDMLNVIAKR